VDRTTGAHQKGLLSLKISFHRLSLRFTADCKKNAAQKSKLRPEIGAVDFARVDFVFLQQFFTLSVYT